MAVMKSAPLVPTKQCGLAMIFTATRTVPFNIVPTSILKPSLQQTTGFKKQANDHRSSSCIKHPTFQGNRLTVSLEESSEKKGTICRKLKHYEGHRKTNGREKLHQPRQENLFVKRCTISERVNMAPARLNRRLPLDYPKRAAPE